MFIYFCLSSLYITIIENVLQMYVESNNIASVFFYLRDIRTFELHCKNQTESYTTIQKLIDPILR